jgi:hypothetical protein
MTPNGWRRLALGLPGAIEGEHMDHPDFRVRGKIFATIHPDDAFGVVMLTPAQQKEFVRDAPDAFKTVKGGWGRHGATLVVLKAVNVPKARSALLLAWRNKVGDQEPPGIGVRSNDR